MPNSYSLAWSTPINAKKSPAFIPRRTFMVLILLGLVAVLLGYFKFTYRPPQITSYEECVNSAGSRIQESYPAVCVTASGQRFLQPVETTPVPPPTPLPTSTPTPTLTNPDTGWLIHRLPGFKLETPPEWMLLTTEPVTLVNSGNQTTPRDFDPEEHAGQLRLEIYTATTNQSLSEYLEEQRSLLDQATDTAYRWQTAPLSLAGQPATRVKTDLPGFLVFVVDPGQNQIIQLAFLLDFDHSTGLANQIMETFTFLEETCPAICTYPSDQTCPVDQLEYTSLDTCACPIDFSCSADTTPTATTSAQTNCIVTGCSGQIGIHTRKYG